MSLFDSLTNKALGISQGFFGDNVTYKQGTTTQNLKAVFATITVEFNSYQTQALSCEILDTDLSFTPAKGDTITKASKVYKVDSAQLNNGVYLLILKE